MNILDIATLSEQKVIETTCKVLADGGLVIFPTETTYGAAVDATNPEAVNKLLDYKSRREGKPLSIAVTDQAMAEQFVELNDQAKQLYRQFLPGPVTVVSRGRKTVAPGVESEFGTLGVRIPAYPLILKLLRAYGKPITATSGNGSGQKRPYTIQDVFDYISDKQKQLIDLVLDAGTLPENPPSTVIDTTLSTPVVMRQGELKVADSGNSTMIETSSEQETRHLAGKILLKHWNRVKETGLIIALDGPLGAGKTVFAKGVAEFLQIKDTLSSPTYTYIEEYNFSRHGFNGMLFHLDMWKVSSVDEFSRLEVSQLLKPGAVIVIEWWNQVDSYWQTTELPLIKILVEDLQSHRRFHITES